MKKNKTPLVALVVLVLVGVVGGTIAYFTSTETFGNLFGTGRYSTTIKEDFTSPKDWVPGTTTSKTVEVTNNGNVPVVVRAKIEKDHGWYRDPEDDSTKLDIDENVTVKELLTDWEKVGDYYYYKRVLNEGEKTRSSFIESVTFDKNAKIEQECVIKYVYTDNSEDEGIKVDGKQQPTEGKTVKSTLKNCGSNGESYDGATYKLNITVETMQYSAYKDEDAWGANAPTILAE